MRRGFHLDLYLRSFAVALYFAFLGGAHPLRRGLKDTREVSTQCFALLKEGFDA